MNVIEIETKGNGAIIIPHDIFVVIYIKKYIIFRNYIEQIRIILLNIRGKYNFITKLIKFINGGMNNKRSIHSIYGVLNSRPLKIKKCMC